MQKLRGRSLPHASCFLVSAYQNICRNASLTSAISRGIRKGANSLDRIGTTRRDTPAKAQPATRNTSTPRSRLEIERLERSSKPHKKRWTKDTEPRKIISHEAPQGVPYTTAGSEFLYGTFAVKAALEANRRRLYKLYVWCGEGTSDHSDDESISKLARSKKIAVQNVAGSWDRMLLRMSGQRPHNGYVLESSPVPKLPISRLEKMEGPNSNLIVTMLPQSVEAETVNKVFKATGTTATIRHGHASTRFPLLLWLDRITDTGNLGAIIRTAYFFGVDAIIIPEHGTAPFSPVTVKASAGTAEYLPILTVQKELDFVQDSQKHGWKFFAGVAPDSASTKRGRGKKAMHSVSNALDNGPCVLMVGNEGEGLRSFIQKAADEPLSIESGRRSLNVVDSLNVSVAAALLMARFLTPSAPPALQTSSSKEDEPASKSKPEHVF